MHKESLGLNVVGKWILDFKVVKVFWLKEREGERSKEKSTKKKEKRIQERKLVLKEGQIFNS